MTDNDNGFDNKAAKEGPLIDFCDCFFVNEVFVSEDLNLRETHSELEID